MIRQRRKNRNQSQNLTDSKTNESTLKVRTATAPKNWVLNVKEQLKIDEGYKLEIYLDSEGLPTFGIGHLVTKADPEYNIVKQEWPFIFDKSLTIEEKMVKFKESNKKVKISESRVKEAFEKDLLIAISDAKKIFAEFNGFCDELKEIIVNMSFNLGINRLSGFKRMIKAIKEGDFKEAAVEMIDSKWYYQVKGRAKRLVARMEALAQK